MLKTQYKIVVLAISVFGISTLSFADLALRIVDVPQSVWIYSPLIVTAELFNNGNSAILVPVEGFGGNGWGFELKSNNKWKGYDTGFIADGIGTKLVWLKPNESYFVQSDLHLASQKEGTVELRAAIESSGECQQLEHGWPPPSYPVKKISDITKDVVYLIECWKGYITSEPRKVKIELPDNESDRKILTEALAGKYSELSNDRRNDVFTIAHSFSTMMKLFPQSHYTYVAAFYAPPSAFPVQYWYSMPLLLKTQPNSPLTPYARVQLILETLYRQDNPAYEGRFPAIDVSKQNLPAALEKYVKQQIAEKQLEKFWTKEKLKQDLQGLW
jgi:hypothetical protein